MAMNKDKMRLIQAQKKREQEKEWKEEFSCELGGLRDLLEDDEIADDIPYAVRKQIKSLVEHIYATKVIFHHSKEKKDAPTDAEKIKQPEIYSRCNVCETLIKTSLMSRHKERAKCAETAKTRFHDAKFKKDKTAIPRVRVKERVAEMVEKYDVPEKIVVEAVLKQTRPTTQKEREKEKKKLSKDIIEEEDEEEVSYGDIPIPPMSEKERIWHGFPAEVVEVAVETQPAEVVEVAVEPPPQPVEEIIKIKKPKIVIKKLTKFKIIEE